MKKSITKLLRGLKDYNIYFEDIDGVDILEEYETPYDLYEEICIQIYNKYFDMSFSHPEFLKEIEGVFLLKRDGKRVYMKEFLPYIYKTETERRMYGDERYLEPSRIRAFIDHIKLIIRTYRKKEG